MKYVCGTLMLREFDSYLCDKLIEHITAYNVSFNFDRMIAISTLSELGEQELPYVSTFFSDLSTLGKQVLEEMDVFSIINETNGNVAILY